MIESNLIAHYKMNDKLATAVIIDETGNHNGAVKDAGGTATSVFHSVTGKINNAQDLEGTDDFIEIVDHADFSPIGTPLSINVWANMHNATNYVVVNKGKFGTDGEWSFFTNSEDKLIFVRFDESAKAYIGQKSDNTLTSYENSWAMFTVTSDGSGLSSGIKLYLDGVLLASSAYEARSFTEIENLTATVDIGRYSV